MKFFALSIAPEMGRKYTTVWDGESCRSGYKGSTFTGMIFSFPSDEAERDRWINALPNYIDCEKVTRHRGICELHWKSGYETRIVQGGFRTPKHPPAVFGTTKPSFRRQTEIAPPVTRNIETRRVSSAARVKGAGKIELEKDKITSWDSLVDFCQTLNLTVFKTDIFIRLCKTLYHLFCT